MKVEDLMQNEVFTVEPDDLVDRVFLLLHHEKIRHVPVVEKNRVVGIVSDRDMYKVLGPRGDRDRLVRQRDKTALYVIPRKVRHIMRRGVITIAPDADVATAASLMSRRRIGALPVVQGGTLAGIVTATDLLRALAHLAADRVEAPSP